MNIKPQCNCDASDPTSAITEPLDHEDTCPVYREYRRRQKDFLDKHRDPAPQCD